MSSNTKKLNQRKHFKRRMFERYGVEINRKDIETIVKSIQNREAKFLSRTSNRVTLWEVDYQGLAIPVVYDSQRKTVVTALPQEDQISP